MQLLVNPDECWAKAVWQNSVLNFQRVFVKSRRRFLRGRRDEYSTCLVAVDGMSRKVRVNSVKAKHKRRVGLGDWRRVS